MKDLFDRLNKEKKFEQKQITIVKKPTCLDEILHTWDEVIAMKPFVIRDCPDDMFHYLYGGNMGSNLGTKSFGGIIEINGNLGNIAPETNSTIYHNGKMLRYKGYPAWTSFFAKLGF